MANFANPTVGSNYTDFPGEIRASVDAALQQLSVGSHTNIPTGAIKFDTSANRWKKFNGSAFVDLTSTYDLNANVSVNQLNLGDDEKIRLGNSQDFEIFHQSSNSNSIIKETGGGLLSLQTNGNQINLFDIANSAFLAQFNTGGSCIFAHAGTTRLETDGNGIRVTDRVGIGGSASASLDVFGNIVQFGASNTTDQQFRLGRSGSGNRNAYIDIIGDNTYSLFGLRIVRNGTQGSNAISEINHRGTGIFKFTCQDAGQFQFLTSNTTKATITSAGRLGIGTSNPSGLLHVEGSSSGTETYGRFSTGSANGDQNLYIQSGSSRDHMALQVKTGAGVNDDLSLNPSGGNVGIGTTSPEEIVHIKGPTEAIGSRDGVLLQHSTASNAANNGLPLVWSGYISASNTNYGLASICGRKENSIDNNAAAYLEFGTSNSAGAISSKMRLDSSGRLGIGTTSPNTKFHLTGDQPKLRIESTNSLDASAGTEEIGRIEFEGTKGSNINVAASMRVRQDGTWSTSNDFFSPTAIEFYTQDQSGTEITSPRLTINSSGKVGIGTASPNDTLEIGAANSQLRITDTDDSKFVQFSYSGGKLITRNNSTSTTTAQFTLDESGRLGIGTTSPTEELTIESATPAVMLKDTDLANSYVQLSAGNGDMFLSANDTQHNGQFFFRSGLNGTFTERARIQNQGRLGLGTSNPSSLLHLIGTQTVQAGAFSANVTTGNKTFTASIDIQATSMRGGVVVRNMNNFRSESIFNASFMHYDPFDTTATSIAFRAARGATLADTFSVRSDGRTFIGERLGVGTSSPERLLHVVGSDCRIRLSDSDVTADFEIQNVSGDGVITTNADTTIIIKPNNNETFRTTSTALRIGQTSANAPGQDNTTVGAGIGKDGRISSSTSGTITGLNLNANITSNTKHYISFRRDGSQIGSVTQNGASNVQYNVGSDRRLKENIIDLKDALTNLLKLKPRRFNFIADETKQTVDGLIAQEVEETGVCLNAVWKDKDNKEMMQIDYSKFMTLAIAAIQELAGKVSDLEAKLG